MAEDALGSEPGFGGSRYRSRAETSFDRSIRAARDGDAEGAAGLAGRRSRRRQWLVAGVFLLSMGAAALRLADIAAESERAEQQGPVVEKSDKEEAAPLRRALVDRNGVPLAGGVRLYDLHFDTSLLSFPGEGAEAARQLAALFPEVDAAWLEKRLTQKGDPRVKSRATPREAQEAYDLGWPSLHMFARTERFFYPGRLTAHLLGGVNHEGKGYDGVEGALDEMLAAGGDPVPLSVDLRIQGAVRDALMEAMIATKAKAAGALVLSPETGEVLALVSLPDFDPHRRPRPPSPDQKPKVKPERSPLFNHAAQGLYELGSVMKLVTWALALETGAAKMSSVYDPPVPFELDGYTISDSHRITHELSFPMALAESSNIIAAQLALEVGPKAQHELFEALGLHATSGLELTKALSATPRWPDAWGRVNTATASYGHGVSMTLAHMAAATATLVNGGEKVTPTLLRRDGPPAERRRVISALTSKRMREMMRLVVTAPRGTGRRADVPGLEVGGKTGTANKNEHGRYLKDKVVSSFVAAFPISDPKAVVAVLLDEPQVEVGGRLRRGADITAAPAARAVIERIAPLMGIAPRQDVAGLKQ